MKRSNNILLIAVAGLLMPFAGASAQEEGATDLASAITSGEASISGRYRYEHVDQDNVLDNANASTLRLRLNYRTGQLFDMPAITERAKQYEVPLIWDLCHSAGALPVDLNGCGVD